MTKTKQTVITTALCSSILFAGGDVAPIKVPIKPIVNEVEEVSNWSFELMPYFAMSGLSGDSSIISTATSQVDLPFDDILDALEFSVPIHAEILNKSGWGIWLDYSYMSLGGSGLIPTGHNITLDVKQTTFEGYAMYRQPIQNSTIDYMAGVRSWKLKMDAEISGLPNLNKTDNDWVDFVVGARWTTNINKDWKFYTRGDIGAGDSDLTATVVVGFRYTMNEWLDFDIKYKALWVDYETGTPNTIDYFAYDTLTQGPIIGLNFKF